MNPGNAGIRDEYRRLRLFLIAVYAALAAGTLATAAWYLHSEYREILTAAQARSSTLTRALEEHVLRTFTTVDTHLRNAGRRLVETRALEGPSTPAVVEVLRGEVASAGFLRSIYVYDTAGQGHTTSLGSDIGHLRARDFDYLAEVLDGPAGRLVIGRVISGAVTRRPNIPVARAVLEKNGRLAGIIGTAIEPGYFEEFYKALNLKPGESIALFRSDGAVLVRVPQVPDRPANVSGTPIFREVIARNTAGTADAVSVIDGIRRLIAYRHVPGWNLIVFHTESHAAVIASWWRVVRVVGLLVFAALGILLTLLLLALREFKRRAEAETETRRLNAELEQRVRERTAKLQAANRELETFSYSVAHDLRAPLRGIDGYSRLLQADYSDRLDDEGRGFLRNIVRATQQTSQLIDDLLAYSRLERRDMQIGPVDPRALIESLLADRAEDIRARGVTVSVDVACPSVTADPEGLAMALRNLLENALKFTRDAAKPAIEIGARDDGAACVLWVRDNGTGFDMQFHDRIFDIFQRLHRSEDYPGTGVGLAIVKKAIERMGGRAWAKSEPGKGATFFLEIPE